VLFHDRIVALFVAPEYRVVSGLLPLMILAGGLYAAGQIAVLSLLSGVNSRALIAPKIVTALLGVALNFAGAFWFGLNGVVWAGVLFGLIYLVWIIFLTRRMKEPPTAEGHP
jgi:O-antigen/teichoic acid export membrane protein